MWEKLKWVICALFRRKEKGPQLEINYKENDDRYCYRVPGEQLHWVFIINSSWKTIKEGMVAITDMKPLPDVFTSGFPTLKILSIKRGKTPVDVIKWVYGQGSEKYEFIQWLKIIPSKFSVTDVDHEITITVSGKNIKPVSRKFKFGIKRIRAGDDIFWFRPVN
jgi:hypothetical protein